MCVFVKIQHTLLIVTVLYFRSYSKHSFPLTGVALVALVVVVVVVVVAEVGRGLAIGLGCGRSRLPIFFLSFCYFFYRFVIFFCKRPSEGTPLLTLAAYACCLRPLLMPANTHTHACTHTHTHTPALTHTKKNYNNNLFCFSAAK